MSTQSLLSRLDDYYSSGEEDRHLHYQNRYPPWDGEESSDNYLSEDSEEQRRRVNDHHHRQYEQAQQRGGGQRVGDRELYIGAYRPDLYSSSESEGGESDDGGGEVDRRSGAKQQRKKKQKRRNEDDTPVWERLAKPKASQSEETSRSIAGGRRQEGDVASVAESNIHGKEWNKTQGVPTAMWNVSPFKGKQEGKKGDTPQVAADRLYSHAVASHKKVKTREADHEADEKKENAKLCTWRPDINQASRDMVGNSRPLYDRVQATLAINKAKQLNVVAAAMESEGKECKFTPETLPNSAHLARTFNVKQHGDQVATLEPGHRLHNVFEQHQWRKAQRVKALQEEPVGHDNSIVGGGIISARQARNSASRLHQWEIDNAMKKKHLTEALTYVECGGKVHPVAGSARSAGPKTEATGEPKGKHIGKRVDVVALLDRLVPKDHKIGPKLPDGKDAEGGGSCGHNAEDSHYNDTSQNSNSSPRRLMDRDRPRPSPRHRSRFSPLFDAFLRLGGGKNVAKKPQDDPKGLPKSASSPNNDAATLSYLHVKAFILENDPKNASLVSALHRQCAGEVVRSSHQASGGLCGNMGHGNNASVIVGGNLNRPGAKKTENAAERYFYDPVKGDVYIDHNTFCDALETYEQEFGPQRWSVGKMNPERTKIGLGRLGGPGFEVEEDSLDMKRAKFLAWCDNGGLPPEESDEAPLPIYHKDKKPSSSKVPSSTGKRPDSRSSSLQSSQALSSITPASSLRHNGGGTRRPRVSPAVTTDGGRGRSVSSATDGGSGLAAADYSELMRAVNNTAEPNLYDSI